MDFKETHKQLLKQVEATLDRLVPPADTRPARLHTAMRYSLEAGGKRLRPVLALSTAALFGRSSEAEAAAVALECVHTYSLIHDDLPCMDDDDLRRGRPTAHVAFDEATALLAGDALLTHAFFLLGDAYAGNPALATALLRELGAAAGSRRLVGGQMADLQAEAKKEIDAGELEFIHSNKTGAMIEASFVMGGLCGGASGEQVERLRRCGTHVGLAFQIVDDILDVTSDSATLGKTAGKDLKADKTTFIKVHGMETARRRVATETEAALTILQSLPGDSSFLRELIRLMAVRIS